MKHVIDFSTLKLHNKEPVYAQIVRFVKQQILLGTALDSDELPSRRELAFQLDINPNTVQKAFKQMEDEGFVRTGSNVRSQLIIDDAVYTRIEEELTLALVREFVQSAREVKLSYNRVIEMLGQMWNE